MKTRHFVFRLCKDKCDITGAIVKAGTLIETSHVTAYFASDHYWISAYGRVGEMDTWFFPSEATLIEVSEEEITITVTKTVLYKKPE